MSAPQQPGRVGDDEFVVAACTRVDRAEQEALFAQCFKKPLAPGGLAWRYDASPVGESISLVARPPDGEAVSGYACSPRRAIGGGDEATAGIVGETGDVMTHPDWRKRGFFSRLDRAALEEARRRGWVLAFGLPNHRSAHIFLELGWEPIGTLRAWTFLLHLNDAARSARAREGRWRAFLTPFAVLTCRRGRARLCAARAAFRSEPLARFPDEVAALARRVEPRFGFMLRRDAPYLNWRFIDAPSRLHRAFALREAGELAAYVVVQVPRLGSAHGYLVDILGRDDQAVDAALAVGLAELERAGASAVEASAVDGSWWSARLRGAGFLAPRPAHHLTIILHPLQPDHPLVAAARDTSKWYFTDGDRDDETMG